MQALRLPEVNPRMISHSRRVCTVVVSLAFTVCAGAIARGQVDVPMQHNDNERTGANLRETVLKPSNIDPIHFGMLFKHLVDDQVYTQPLLLTSVLVGGGYHDIVL